MELEKPCPFLQKRKFGLPDYGDWWQGSFEVPKFASILDFVFSDADQRAWDNNRNRDFHVKIEDALSREELIQVCTSQGC